MAVRMSLVMIMPIRFFSCRRSFGDWLKQGRTLVVGVTSADVCFAMEEDAGNESVASVCAPTGHGKG